MTFLRIPAVAALAVVALSACGTTSVPAQRTTQASQSAPATASPTPTCAHFSGLTGICSDANAPVLIVKIDDVGEARPQFHLNQADLVLVEPVEGGLTRLFAVYNSTFPDTIGPIRSARITDTDLAPAFGDPLFAYSGSQGKLVPYLRATRMQMVGAPQGGLGYRRLSDRPAPHNYVADVPTLLGRVSDSSTARLAAKSYWAIADSGSESGTAIGTATIKWPSAQKSFTWVPADKRWDISVYAKPLLTQIDTAGATERAHTTNVVIMDSVLQNSEFGDKFGARTPYPQTIGTGKGMVLVDGKSIPATWHRASKDDLPHWYSLDGHEIALRPGNTWWLIVNSLNDVTLASSTGAVETATAR